MDARRAAGLGLLAYGVLTPVAFMTIGAPGGAYEEHAVATYLASSHWALAFGLAYLGAFAGLGLLVFGTRMGELVGAAGPVVRGLGVAGAAAGVIGWFLVGGISVAFAEGSRPVVANVPHSVVYLVSEMSNLVAVCASAFFLGATALVLAGTLRETLPRWLRIAHLRGRPVRPVRTGVLPAVPVLAVGDRLRRLAGPRAWRRRRVRSPAHGVPLHPARVRSCGEYAGARIPRDRTHAAQAPGP